MKKEAHKQNSLMAIVAIVAIIAIVSLVLLIKKPVQKPEDISVSDVNIFQELLSVDSTPGNIVGQALSQRQQDKIQAAFDVNPQKVLDHIINKWSPEKIARFVKITTRILALPRSKIEDILQNQLGLGLSQIQPFIDLLQFLLNELNSMEICGNTKCDPNETPTDCPTDCEEPSVCGDGVCGADEDPTNCVADCGSGGGGLVCSDQVYQDTCYYGCDNQQCSPFPNCCVPNHCPNSQPTTNPETQCSDGFDNDCDGQTDTQDSDCTGGGGPGPGDSVWSFLNGNLEQNPVSSSTKEVVGRILWINEFKCLNNWEVFIIGADTEKVIVVIPNREFPPNTGPLRCDRRDSIYHGLYVKAFDINNGKQLWEYTIRRDTSYGNIFGMQFLYGIFAENKVIIAIFQQAEEQLDILSSTTGFVILDATTGTHLKTLDGDFINKNPIKIKGMCSQELNRCSAIATSYNYWPGLLHKKILYYSSAPYRYDDISRVIGVYLPTKQIVFTSEPLANVKISINGDTLLAYGFEPIVISTTQGEVTAIKDPRGRIIVGYNISNGVQQFRRADQNNDMEPIPRHAFPLIYGNTIYVNQRAGQFGEIPGLAKIDIDTGEIITIVKDVNDLPITHFLLEDLGISSEGLGATDRRPDGVELARGPVFDDDNNLEIYYLKFGANRPWVALNRAGDIEWLMSNSVSTPPVANKNLVYASMRKIEYQLEDLYGWKTQSMMRILDIQNKKAFHWVYEGNLLPRSAMGMDPIISDRSDSYHKPMLLVDGKIITKINSYRDIDTDEIHDTGIVVLGGDTSANTGTSQPSSGDSSNTWTQLMGNVFANSISPSNGFLDASTKWLTELDCPKKGDTKIIGADQDYVYVLNKKYYPTDGSCPYWHGELISGDLYRTGRVGDKVIAINKQTGEIAWTHSINVKRQDYVRIKGQLHPDALMDFMYGSLADGKLYLAYFQPTSRREFWGDIKTEFAVVIIDATSGNRLDILDIEIAANPIYRASGSDSIGKNAVPRFLINNNIMYYVTGYDIISTSVEIKNTGHAVAFDLVNKKFLWKSGEGLFIPTLKLTEDGQLIMKGIYKSGFVYKIGHKENEHRIISYDAKTGSQNWRKVYSSISHAVIPQVYGDLMYIHPYDANTGTYLLLEVNLKTGSEKFLTNFGEHKCEDSGSLCVQLDLNGVLVDDMTVRGPYISGDQAIYKIGYDIYVSLDKNTGRSLWSMAAREPIHVTMGADGKIYNLNTNYLNAVPKHVYLTIIDLPNRKLNYLLKTDIDAELDIYTLFGLGGSIGAGGIMYTPTLLNDNIYLTIKYSYGVDDAMTESGGILAIG